MIIWLFSTLFNAISAKMVVLPGFEPGTSPLSGVRSNQLSYKTLLVTL
jgi:hypothetical protein